MNGATVHMRFEVRDFTNWYRIFSSASYVAMRRASGLVRAMLFQDERSPNVVFAVLEWSSVQGAQSYLEDRRFLARMAGAGVVGLPEIRFVRRV